MEEKSLRESLLKMIQEADDEEIAVIHRLVQMIVVSQNEGPFRHLRLLGDCGEEISGLLALQSRMGFHDGPILCVSRIEPGLDMKLGPAPGFGFDENFGRNYPGPNPFVDLIEIVNSQQIDLMSEENHLLLKDVNQTFFKNQKNELYHRQKVLCKKPCLLFKKRGVYRNRNLLR